MQSRRPRCARQDRPSTSCRATRRSGQRLPGRESWRLDGGSTPTETRAKPRDAHKDRLRFRRRAFEAFARARGMDDAEAKKLWTDWRVRDRTAGREEQRGGEHDG